jgi:hypothetical protein
MITRGPVKANTLISGLFPLGEVPQPRLVIDYCTIAAARKERALSPLSVSTAGARSMTAVSLCRVEFIISHMLTRFPATQGRGFSSGPPVRPSLS